MSGLFPSANQRARERFFIRFLSARTQISGVVPEARSAEGMSKLSGAVFLPSTPATRYIQDLMFYQTLFFSTFDP